MPPEVAAEGSGRRRAISRKVFVGNLSFDVTREELIEAFTEVGRVVDAKVPTDRETGRPRGFAFVEFEDEEAVPRCVEQLLGREQMDAFIQQYIERFKFVSITTAEFEEFVEELKSSGIDYAVLRPTGYFSDMGEFFEMARRGRVWLIGSGDNRVNPIHGADLAVACVDAVEGDASEIDVGGPQTFTWKEVAALAFEEPMVAAEELVVGNPHRHVRLAPLPTAAAPAAIDDRNGQLGCPEGEFAAPIAHQRLRADQQDALKLA